MALELHIFVEGSRVPSRNDWQRAIEECGFQTLLDLSLDVRRAAGFTPATYKGQSTGFEFRLEPAADVVLSYGHVASHIGSRDMCATFRWGGNLAECAAAISAAAGLAKLTDGVYFYPDDDIIRNAEETLEATRQDLRSM